MIISNAQGLKDLGMLANIGQHLMQQSDDSSSANYLTTLIKVHGGFKEAPVIKEIKIAEFDCRYGSPYVSCYVEQVGGIFNKYWIYVNYGKVEISIS